MRRQTIDGQPIYKDEIWNKMLETGKILLELGYQETSKKPNLFYKIIYKDNGEYEILFADLRGTKSIPIWKELRLSLYPNSDWKNGYSFNSIDFGFQYILLRRSISIPIISDYAGYTEYDRPVGYCEKCNKDILLGKDLTKSQYFKDLDSDIELYYCDDCKKGNYNEIRETEQCVHCKERYGVVDHHISYDPELTIRVCKKCHLGKGGIHWWGFPNLLWKQRKSDFEELKRKRKRKIDAKKPIIIHICEKCDKEIYSTKKSFKCPVCKIRMKSIEQTITNFHCSKCLKTWAGLISQDYCPNCALSSSKKIDEEGKMILKINIQSRKDIEQRKKYIRLFIRNFQDEDDSFV